MCGLCGVLSTTLSSKEINAFQDLMVVSTLRGSFGSGIVLVPESEKNEIEVLRHESYTAAELAYSADFYGAYTKHQLSCLMGHARHPTKGGMTIEHTHPHQCGHIIGMHNGTLTEVNNTRIPTPKKGEDGVSDSQLLFESIADLGVEAAIAACKGSYALSFLDTKTDSLHFLRNEDRPFYWAMVGSTNTLYWASESEMLRLVLGRIFPASVINVYKSQPDILTSFRSRPVSKIGYYDKTPVSQTKGKIQAPAITPASDPIVMVETKKGHYIRQVELLEVLTSGCTYCNRPGLEMDFKAKRMFWVDQTNYVCYDCARYDQFAADYLVSEGHILPAVH